MLKRALQLLIISWFGNLCTLLFRGTQRSQVCEVRYTSERILKYEIPSFPDKTPIPKKIFFFFFFSFFEWFCVKKRQCWFTSAGTNINQEVERKQINVFESSRKQEASGDVDLEALTPRGIWDLVFTKGIGKCPGRDPGSERTWIKSRDEELSRMLPERETQTKNQSLRYSRVYRFSF